MRYNSLAVVMAGASEATTKVKETWDRKLAPLKRFNTLFENAGKDNDELSEEDRAARERHFAYGNSIWQAGFRRFAATLEKEIVGPLCLGDQLSLADLYLAPYVTRLVVMSGGDGTPDGILAVSRHANLYLPDGVAKWDFGPKVKTWWITMIEQACFQKVYKSGIF